MAVRLRGTTGASWTAGEEATIVPLLAAARRDVLYSGGMCSINERSGERATAGSLVRMSQAIVKFGETRTTGSKNVKSVMLLIEPDRQRVEARTKDVQTESVLTGDKCASFGDTRASNQVDFQYREEPGSMRKSFGTEQK